MSCPQSSPLDNTVFLADLNRRIERRRVPLCGSFELTRRCNLRCVHCYLHDSGTRGELETGRWLSVIDEITAAGCLFLLLTGGEPLLRPDFAAVYRHAKRSGLLVTLFTNGTRIDSGLLELLAELPPQSVEISLYGATAATHDAVTGVPGSFDRCRQGIHRLLENGTRLQLKTMLMTANRHELGAMREWAAELGVEFRFDAALFPRLDGDPTPLSLRVDPREAVRREFEAPRMRAGYREQFLRGRGHGDSGRLYECGAGISNFHVDAIGRLQPCLMTTGLQYDLKNGSFEDGWRRHMVRIRQQKAPADMICRGCELKSICGFCPAFFELETGAPGRHSDFVCRMGHLRHEQIGDLAPIERNDHDIRQARPRKKASV